MLLSELNLTYDHLLSIFDTIPQGIIVLDRDFKIIYWNKALEYLDKNKYIDKKILNRNFFEVFPENIISKWIPISQEIINTEESLFLSDYHISNDQLDLWVDVRVSPIKKQSDNTVIGLIIIITDNSLRKKYELELKMKNEELQKLYYELEKKIEERTNELKKVNNQLRLQQQNLEKMLMKLHQSEERYRNLFENANNPIHICNINGILIDVNKKVSEIIGYNKEEIIGKHFKDFVHPDDLEKTISSFKEIINGTQKISEFRVKCKDGNYILLSSHAYPLKENENIIGMVGIMRNITEERIQEEKLRLINEKLSKLSEAKSYFLANMGHELKTPLNSIIGYSEMLLENLCGELNPQQQEYINNVLNSSRYLLDVINDILDFSKIESGTLELHYTEIDIYQVINEIEMTFSPILQQKNQKLIIDIEENLPIIQADELKLKQIIFNLISNASKYSDENTEIKLTCQRKDKNVIFCVIDKGIGIDKKDQNLIFQRFQQLETHKNKSFKGIGLGLAIVKGLLELHGGNIWIESEQNKGSKFCFTIPIMKKN